MWPTPKFEVSENAILGPEVATKASGWPLRPNYQLRNTLRSALIGLILVELCIKLTKELTLRSALMGLISVELCVKLTKDLTLRSALMGLIFGGVVCNTDQRLDPKKRSDGLYFWSSCV